MNDQIQPAALKQALRQLRDLGDTTHQRFQDLTLPRGEITLAWGLSDPRHVSCIAYTREPLPLVARPVVDQLLAAFNRTSAIKVELEAANTDGVHAADCLCAGLKITFNEFITVPDLTVAPPHGLSAELFLQTLKSTLRLLGEQYRTFPYAGGYEEPRDWTSGRDIGGRTLKFLKAVASRHNCDPNDLREAVHHEVSREHYHMKLRPSALVLKVAGETELIYRCER